MPKGVVAYIVSLLAVTVLFSGAFWALQNAAPAQMKGLVALLFILYGPIPLIIVQVLHRREAAGNPYRGLVWGPTSWFFLLFLGGLLAGACVLLAQLALGLVHFDPHMQAYIELSREAGTKSSGKELPASVDGTFAVVGMVTSIVALTLGPWFGAAFGSMITFPQYGWLGRRLLTRGRATAVLILMTLAVLTALSGGLIDNPQLGELSLPVRLGLYALTGLAAVPAAMWIFLKTRSAVLPALFGASYGAAMAAAFPFMADYASWLSNPQIGVASSGGLLLIGLALWVWQDPGGNDLAVAAVASDGTPLTPEMLARAEGEFPAAAG
jgi:hypothetical protein